VVLEPEDGDGAAGLGAEGASAGGCFGEQADSARVRAKARTAEIGDVFMDSLVMGRARFKTSLYAWQGYPPGFRMADGTFRRLYSCG
jgi:hypothetical protein